MHRYAGQPSSNGPRPQATLFVGNLAYSVDESILKDEITRYIDESKIASIRFPVDKDTGKKRGFAYVDLIHEDDAKKLFYEMHGQEVMGRKVAVDDATRR